MNLRKTIQDILNAVVANGTFPDAFLRELKRGNKPYCIQGGMPSRAYPVSFGDARVFWEYDRQICANDQVPEKARFNPNASWDIPSLSNGRNVRYYLNTNIGYKGWHRFVKVVQNLENWPEQFIAKEEAECLLASDY